MRRSSLDHSSSRSSSRENDAAGGRRSLKEYERKRDFSVTSEPSGRTAPKANGGFSYVIQKHRASHLHYDFRLELDGVLLSWAVPKGPSLDPSVKRLAMPTEDHPLDYGSFEGTIPAGEYGGGTVMVWDRGTWTPDGDPRASYAKGNLTFTLHGDKLRGRWHLVRSHRAGEKRPGWLIFKSKDAESSTTRDIVVDETRSAKTGRTLDEIADAKRGSVWHSNRGLDEDLPKKEKRATPSSKKKKRKARSKAERVVPALDSFEPKKRSARRRHRRARAGRTSRASTDRERGSRSKVAKRASFLRAITPTQRKTFRISRARSRASIGPTSSSTVRSPRSAPTVVPMSTLSRRQSPRVTKKPSSTTRSISSPNTVRTCATFLSKSAKLASSACSAARPRGDCATCRTRAAAARMSSPKPVASASTASFRRRARAATAPERPAIGCRSAAST